MANQVLPATAFFLMEAVRFDFAVEIVETKYQTKTYLGFVWWHLIIIHLFYRNAASLLARQDFNELLQYTGGDYSSIASLQKELVKYESFPIAVPRSNAATLKTFNYK